MKRNLLIVRAGNKSCHPDWVRGETPRDFDLMVSYYGTIPDMYREGSDHYHRMSGPRWPAHDAICREQAELIARYDYVGFACDDLEADLGSWNKLFALCRQYRLDLAQPAITGHPSFAITRPHLGCILRFTNFVEIMCPVFSQRAIQKLSGTFGKSVSGWGLDIAWGSLLTRDEPIAIIDCVHVRHSQPLWKGTLYPLLSSKGIDPYAERDSLIGQYGGRDFAPREYSRLMTAPHRDLQSLCPQAYRIYDDFLVRMSHKVLGKLSSWIYGKTSRVPVIS